MKTQGETKRNQIDRYVNNEMQGEELAQFEQRMREHVELAESVHFHRDVLQGIEYYFIKELKKDLIQSDIPKPKRNLKTYLAIAASVVVLAGAGLGYYFLKQGEMNPSGLAATYFEPYPNIIAPVSRSAAASSTEEAMQLYETEQYAAAITQLNSLINQNPDHIGLVFYRGVSYLGSHQPEKAMADFENVIEKGEPSLREPAYWYLGLSQLATGQKVQAKASFLRVNEAEGVLAGQSQQILKAIQ